MELRPLKHSLGARHSGLPNLPQHLWSCQRYHLLFTNDDQKSASLTGSTRLGGGSDSCPGHLRNHLFPSSWLSHLYGRKSYVSHFIRSWWRSVTDLIKNTWQLLDIHLAKTAEGEPGSHFRIPLALWGCTRCTWAQHHGAVFPWASLE